MFNTTFDHYCHIIKNIRNNEFEFKNNIITNIKEPVKKIFGMDCSDQIEEFLANDKWKDYE